MGVKGLMQAMKSRGSRAPERLPSGSTLIVDGDGWAFHILSICSDKFNPLMGGDYNLLNETARSEVASLQRMGINLVFYFGGASDAFKDVTISKRLQQREEKWLQLYYCCRDRKTASSSDLPIPTLGIEQIRSTLASIGAVVVRCGGESDQEIALEVHNRNRAAGTERYFVYGLDSDFLLMKDCPYIEFGTVNCTVDVEAAAAIVYRRSETAMHFGLSEQQLVELGILSGNDFTIEYCNAGELSEFPTTADESYHSNAKNTVLSNCDWIKSKGGGFLVTSTGETVEVDIAIRYSRALYELQDIEPFRRELETHRKSIHYISPDVPFSVGLSKKESSKLAVWIARNPMLARVENQQSVGSCALRYIADRLSETPSETISLNSFEVHFLNEHLEAFRCMFVDILALRSGLGKEGSAGGYLTESAATPKLPTEKKGSDRKTRASAAVNETPQWKDVLVVQGYQGLLRELFKNVDFMDQPPLFNYDGSIFYSHLNCIRANSKAAIDDTKSKDIPALEVRMTGLLIKEKTGPAVERALDTETLKSKKREKTKTSEAMPLSKSEAVDHPRPPKTVLVAFPRAAPSNALPIDAFETQILHKIRTDRVTIIHGETGCGKSSRVPAMILADCKRKNKPCKMMISQPRRIAASSLMKRLRETLGDEVGMRMGHGVRDETDSTKLCFVTTGYLVRLLAYHPEHFFKHTHLIIDEVHERSVDGDVLCYLARKLLSTHPTLKVVLMSATMHIELYQRYFESVPSDPLYYGDLECLSVGARRFPLETFFVEDMCDRSIPQVYKPLCKRIADQQLRQSADVLPSPDLPKFQYKLASNIVREVVENGTGVLIFVSGMMDIIEISELFEEDPKYVVVGIHSDIPYEEQEMAFAPVPPDKIKVIIATNAAESSITLPDVDVVICFGTHKVVRFDIRTGRAQLVNQYISKASASQRAGRTGRTRPGRVYRLYSQKLYGELHEHDAPEVLRKPLPDVILGLRAMMEESAEFEGVLPILKALIEPPKTENVEYSFKHLYDIRLITEPSDEGDLTQMGRVAGNLPVDLQLSRLICFGISLGIGAEAVAMAAALSIPKFPFRTVHPLIHKDPDEFNEIVQKSYLASVRADGGLYSTPLMLVRLLCEWRGISSAKGQGSAHREYRWLNENCIVKSRIQQLDSLTKNLARVVAQILQRVSRRVESRRMPKYDLSGWLAMQDDLELSDGCSQSTISIPLLEDTDCFDEDDNSVGMEKCHDATLNTLSNVRDIRVVFDDDASPEEKESEALRVNLCRLILSWVSDGSLVYQSELGRVPKDHNVVRLGKNALTKRQCESLFPDGINFKLMETGRRTYTGPMGSGSRLDLIHSLCEIAHNQSHVAEDLSLIWVALKDLEAEGETTVILALAGEKMIADVSPLFSGAIDMEEHVLSYKLFALRKASKSNLKELNKLFGTHERVISMLVPAKGASVLTTSGISLPKDAIKLLFKITEEKSAREELMRKNRGSDMDTASDCSDEDVPRGLSMQELDRTQILMFEESIERSPYHFPCPLIKDTSLGSRLLNAYMASRRKERTVILSPHPKFPPTKERHADYARDDLSCQTIPILVPGSKEWIDAKNESVGFKAEMVKGAVLNESFTVVAPKIVSASWNSVYEIQNAGFVRKKLLQNSLTPLLTACHIGPGRVYGVGFGLMDIGMVQTCQGVSLFPIGEKWIRLAFDCIGFSTAILEDKSPVIDARERQLTTLVRELLEMQIQELPVQRNNDLIEAVKALFRPWCLGIDFSNNEAFEVGVNYLEKMTKMLIEKFGMDIVADIHAVNTKVGSEYTSTVTVSLGGSVIQGLHTDKKKKRALQSASFLCYCRVKSVIKPTRSMNQVASSPKDIDSVYSPSDFSGSVIGIASSKPAKKKKNEAVSAGVPPSVLRNKKKTVKRTVKKKSV